MTLFRGYLPILGHTYRMFKYLHINNHPMIQMIRDDYKNQQQPEMLIIAYGFEPTLIISDKEVLQELYYTKNKYFDKHQHSKNIVYPLMGDTLLFQESNENWKQKRKVISSTFYKEKLIKYLNIAKQCQDQTIQEIKQNYINKNIQFDIINAVSKAYIKVILVCIFGSDISQKELDYYENGKLIKKQISVILIETFHLIVMRILSPQMILFPESYNQYIIPKERETKQNIIRMRQEFEQMVQQRKQEMQNSDYIDRGDLLSTLLQDELFKDNHQMIIDECLTFFFAGTQTTALTTANVLLYAQQNPEVLKKIKEEFKSVVYDKFKENHPGKEFNLIDAYTYENIFDQKYYANCFYETLRIEPVVMYSSMCQVTEDITLGKYKIKKGTMFEIDIRNLHLNELEWIDPYKFIPDRFDAQSRYFLTPQNQKRNPLSFGPFLGGKRSCLGKTFAEVISKVIGPSFISLFDYEFIDKKEYQNKTANHLETLYQAEVYVKARISDF